MTAWGTEGVDGGSAAPQLTVPPANLRFQFLFKTTEDHRPCQIEEGGIPVCEATVL